MDQPAVFVKHSGQAEAPTLLLLPGVNCGGWFWEPALPYLLPQFNVLAFNNPGVAGTPYSMLMTVNQIAQRAQQGLVQAGITPEAPLLILGHSLGSFVAQNLAYELGPRVQRLVLVSSTRGQPDTMRDMASMVGTVGQDFWQRELEILRDPYEGLKPFFHPHFLRDHQAEYRHFIQQREAHWPGKRVAGMHIAAGGQFSSMAWIGEVQAPTLVVHGADDVLLSTTSGRALAGALPHGRWWELAECGHFPTLEQADLFWPRVVNFLLGDENVGTPVEHDDYPFKWGW